VEKELSNGKRILYSIAVIFGCLAMMVPTIMAPIVSAAEVMPQTSDELADVTLTDTFKMDRTATEASVSKNEAVTMSIDGQEISFVLVERDILSDDFTINYAYGASIPKAQAREVLKTYVGTDLIGASLVTATITATKMHFAIDMLDGKTYYVDALDGTGRSGYYAAYSSGDLRAPMIVEGSGAVTIPEDLQSTHADRSQTVDSNSSLDALTSEESLFSPVVSAEGRASQETAIGTADSNVSVQATDGQGMAQTMATYSNEVTTYHAEVYLACDYTYWSTHQYWWSDVVTPFFDIAARFEHQTGINQHISRADQLPSTVCTSTDSTTLLAQFRTYLLSTSNGQPVVAASDRDSAMLCSGKTLTGGIVKAYETGAGLAKLKGSGYDGYGCAIMKMQSTMAEKDWLMGHGLALTYNADEYYGQVINGRPTWMYPAYSTSSDLNFETVNIERMKSWTGEVLQMRYINYGPSLAETRFGLNIVAKNIEVSTVESVFTVGSQVTVKFDIENLGTTKTFNTISVVVRESNGDSWNIGFQGPITINAGTTYAYSYTFTPQYSGEYTLWPTFNYQGNTGVSEWLDIHPTFYYKLNSWTFTPGTALASTQLFFRWGVYSLAQSADPGNEIMMQYTIFNTAAGNGATSYQQFFVEIRDPNDACKDAAGVTNPSLSLKGSGYIGGGYHGTSYKTVDVTGVWKISPCYQTSSGGWGPWMAPLLVNVGFFVLPWSQMDNGYISLNNWGATYDIMLPTADNNGAMFSLGFRIFNFNPIDTTLRCPTVVLEIATLYEDRMNTTTNLFDPKDNCIISVKINIEKMIYSKYGVTYGSPGGLNDSAVFWKVGSELNKYAGGTNLYYPSQEFASKGAMGDTALAVLSMMSEEVGLITGITDVLTGMAEMMGCAPLQDTKDIGLTDLSTAWACWYTTQMSVHHTPVPDNSATYNYVELPLHHTGDTYCYRINAEVTYVNKLSFSWDLGYYISNRTTVSTPYVYIAIV